MKFGQILVLATAVFSVPFLGHGEETAVSSSIANNTVESASLLDSVSLSYFGTFHGPSVQSIDSPYTVDRYGKTSKRAINFDSELNAGYKLSKDVTVGVVVPFFAYPVLGEGIDMGDIGVKISDKHAITAPNLNVYANMIVQGPTALDSKNRGMKVALKTTPNVRYNVPGSRFAVGAWTEAKAYFAVTAGKTLKLYGAPYVNYQLSPNFSLNVEYEMEIDHMKNQPGYMSFAAYQSDLQPGFVWNISRSVMLNPYLQVFTTNKVTADSTAVGAILSATIL